jgi:cytochrome c
VNPVSVALAAMISAVGVAHVQAAQVLLQQYKCYICHADEETKTGPAYVDVATKYRGNPQAVAIVAGVVRKGARSGGPWHMPPHPEVSNADATKMARYILSLKK